jgi:dephospho-CoA kinase
MLIGLTGGYCAGKDAVARILLRRGFEVLDVDRIGHEVLEQMRDAVAAAFGESVRRSDGSIDRRAVGRIVFADPAALALLEGIVHPAMVARVRSLAAAGTAAGRDVAVNAALLRHMGLDRFCDAVVEVRARALRRFLRGLRRDGLAPVQVLRRMRAQRSGRDPSGPPVNGMPPGVDTYIVQNDRATAGRLELSVDRLLERLRHRQA